MIGKNIRNINRIYDILSKSINATRKNKFSEDEIDTIILGVVGDSVKQFDTCKSRLLVLRIIEPISTKQKRHESVQIKN